MKIIVMSDTHLHQVTEEFKSLCARYCDSSDMVIHLGDFVGGPVLDYLESRFFLEAVAGNMDNSGIAKRLPDKKVITVRDHRIGLIHGWGSAQNMPSCLAGQFEDVDAVLFGHTHRPFETREDGVLWFNPGSLFSGRGSYPRSFGILEVGKTIESEIVAVQER